MAKWDYGTGYTYWTNKSHLFAHGSCPTQLSINRGPSCRFHSSVSKETKGKDREKREIKREREREREIERDIDQDKAGCGGESFLAREIVSDNKERLEMDTKGKEKGLEKDSNPPEHTSKVSGVSRRSIG